MNIDIHGLERRFECALKQLERSNISENNANIIREFDRWSVGKGVKIARRIKYLLRLMQLSAWFNKNFQDVTDDDILLLTSKLIDSNILSNKSKRYSDASIEDYKIIMKSLFGSFLGKPDIVKGLKRKKALKELKPGDLWTPEELQKLIDSTEGSMEKALIAILVETGCRIGEIGSLQLKSVMPRDYNNIREFELFVSGKTGVRQCLLIWSVPYVDDWLNVHPDKNNSDSPLFVKIYGGVKKVPSYSILRAITKKSVKNSGIDKPSNPHIFRHSVATTLVRLGYHPTKLLRRMGWTLNSNMMERYVHLVSEDVFDEDRKINGITKTEIKRQVAYCKQCSAPIVFGDTCFTCKKLDDERNLAEARKLEIMKLQEQREEQLKVDMQGMIQEQVRNQITQMIPHLPMNTPLPHLDSYFQSGTEPIIGNRKWNGSILIQ